MFIMAYTYPSPRLYSLAAKSSEATPSVLRHILIHCGVIYSHVSQVITIFEAFHYIYVDTNHEIFTSVSSKLMYCKSNKYLNIFKAMLAFETTCVTQNFGLGRESRNAISPFV
jgi:hypothetical protein